MAIPVVFCGGLRRFAYKSAVTATLAVLAVMVSGFGAAIPVQAAAGPTDEESQPTPRLVIAAYFPWYGTPSGPTGRWEHWKDANGNLLIKDHPPFLYDSADATTIRTQLATANQFGVNAFAVSWWGAGSQEDQNFRIMLDTAASAGSPMKLAAQFETPRLAADGTVGIILQLNYLLNSYTAHPNYLRVNGRPVVFIYNPAFWTDDYAQWAAILADPAVAGFHPMFIVDSYTDAAAAVFDGLYMFAPFGPNYPSDAVALFWKYQAAALVARSHHRIFVAAAAPGFDDSVVRTPSMVVPRATYQTYAATWAVALTAQPDWMFIDSWNEWHEATELEPSSEYGFDYLALTGLFSYGFKHPRSWATRPQSIHPRGDRHEEAPTPSPFKPWGRGKRL